MRYRAPAQIYQAIDQHDLKPEHINATKRQQQAPRGSDESDGDERRDER
jgi:hypothetical protein